MVSLDRFDGSYNNAVDDLSVFIYVYMIKYLI